MIDDCRHYSSAGGSRRVVFNEFLERCFRKEWDVSRQQHERASCAVESRLGCQQGVARPKLWLLDHKSEVWALRKGSPDYFCLMP
jgi:hypothetical protein